MKRPAIFLGLGLLLLIAAMAMKGMLLRLPDVPARVEAGRFDTGRATARLARILGDQRPHPVDSDAGDAVRARLLAELRALGLRPRVTDDWACNGIASSRAVSCARVRNVLATIGPAEGRHLLVASHYDSTPTGPGAADAGIGVATMLETAFLLKDRPLARPVTFLFDEGEEAGLLGARAFLERDPLAARVDAVVNLEARGVEGPAIMFETSRPNGPALGRFARSAERPVANSMTTDFYRLVPNSTDLAVFAERGWTALNFAVIGNETRYHSPGDDLAALDPRSVRHMGEQLLAVTAELASDKAASAGGERIYADVVGRGMVVLPAVLGLVLLAGLVLVFAALAWRRRAGIAHAMGAVVLALVGAAALAFVGQAAVGLLRAGMFWRGHPEVIALAVDLSALSACAAALLFVARPLAADRLRAAFWLVFVLLGGTLVLIAPGAAIFFLAPPLVVAAGMVLERHRPGAERVAGALAWLPLFLSWAPLLHLSEVLLDFGSAWMFAPVSAILLLPALIELRRWLRQVPRQGALAAAAALALAGWVAVGLAPAYSLDRKQIFRIEYAAYDGKSRWLVGSDRPPSGAAFEGFRGRVEVPWAGSKRGVADAPALYLAAPRLDRLAERQVAGGRLLTLRLAGGGAGQVLLRGAPGADFRAVRLNSAVRRFGTGEKKDHFFLRCNGRSCDGLVLDLLVGGSRPVDADLIGITPGLPVAAAPLLRARPATAGPQYSPDATIAVVKVRL